MVTHVSRTLYETRSITKRKSITLEQTLGDTFPQYWKRRLYKTFTSKIYTPHDKLSIKRECIEIPSFPNYSKEFYIKEFRSKHF